MCKLHSHNIIEQSQLKRPTMMHALTQMFFAGHTRMFRDVLFPFCCVLASANASWGSWNLSVLEVPVIRSSKR